MKVTGESWREKLVAYVAQEASPVHKFGHQPRLYALTKVIAARSASLIYDDDVVFASAFLHDLGVFVGHRPEEPSALPRWDHVAYACEHVPVLLRSFGFPEEKIEHVVACIREHQPKDEPQSPEATLLRDADMLEQLGAIAILRTAAKLGSDTRFFRFEDVRASLSKALTALPAHMRLPATREMANQRLSTLTAFLEALNNEAGEHLG